MDWQATELNDSWRYAFMALVRRSPAHADPAAIAASVSLWNSRMGILEAHLEATGRYVGGAEFTLADIVIALSVQRWRMSPIERPPLPAVDAYFTRLAARPPFLTHCDNGLP